MDMRTARLDCLGFIHPLRVLPLLLISCAVLFICLSQLPSASGNELAVGRAARLRGTVDIPVNRPVNLNWRTRDEIFSLRQQAVEYNAGLLSDRYVPSQSVFGALEDRRPWWGLAGECIYGSGDRSIDGNSEESRFLLNPYLLVGLNPATLGIWDPRRVTARDVVDPRFPFQWEPDAIRWLPGQSCAFVTYNVSKWHKDIAATGKLLGPVMANRFSLVAYIARDFGFQFLFLHLSKSVNVLNDNNPTEPVFIRQMLHCGNTCGYPGGCNNMSPYMSEIDRCRYTALPARATVYLWREEPSSIHSPADMTFFLELR